MSRTSALSARSSSSLILRLFDGMIDGGVWGCIIMDMLRRGRRFGRVAVNKITLRRPEEANKTSEKTVPAHGICVPVKPIQRVIAIGSTCKRQRI